MIGWLVHAGWFIVGSWFGMALMACCSVAGRADEQAGVK